MSAMQAVADVTPTKGGERMSAITSATVTARYERATGKTHVKVDAVGDDGHGGINLIELEAKPGCYRDGQVLCVEVRFDPYVGGDFRWAKQEVFERSAEFVVLVYDMGSHLRVLTARPVEKV